MFNLIGKAMAQTTTVTGVPRIGIVQPGITIHAVLASVINWVLYAGGFVAIIFLIYGGILYITAGGDAEKATAGRTAIVNAIGKVIIRKFA